VIDRDLKRILVVDDDTSLIRLIGEALRSRFRCEVDATPNPEYGFELALKKRYRVFVFDFSMPMIDGAMLFTLIGKVYNHVNPPIVVPPLILISGRGDEARAQELMKEAGVRGFLPKPFAMNRLMEKINEVAPDLAAASREERSGGVVEQTRRAEARPSAHLSPSSASNCRRASIQSELASPGIPTRSRCSEMK